MKLRLIKSRIIELMLFTSAHGIPRMIRAEQIIIKIMWIAFLIFASSSCAYFIRVATNDYLSYDVVTSISIVREQVSQFPTISICNSFAPMNYSLESFIGKCEFNDDVIENNDLANYFNTFEHPKYGQCFQFNSGTNLSNHKVPVIDTVISGVRDGFLLDVRLEMIPNLDFGELIIYFHNSSLNSSHLYFTNTNGYFLSSGSINFFTIERIYDINLPEPYSNCLKDVTKFKYNKTIINYLAKANSIYSQNLCLRFCSYLYLIEESNCGCEVKNLEDVAAKCAKQWNERNLNQSLKNCSVKYLRDFNKYFIHKKCLKYCPLECESIDYIIIPYSEIIPIQNGSISSLSKSIFRFEEFKTYNQAKSQYVSIAVNYNDLKYTVIERKPKVETYNLVSNIGGTFSLFLGVSFISFIELFEILFEIIIILFEKTSNVNSINK